jgi:urea transport system permease protein
VPPVTLVLSQLFTGISIGAVLLLIALGLALTFGQMNVINMAHGEFIMAGAYTTYVLQTALGTGAITVAFGLALPAAFVVAGTLGLILEFLVIRRLYGRPLDTLLVTWGVGLMLQQAARDLFGAQNVNVDSPAFLDGGVDIGNVSLSYPRLFIIGVVVIVVVAIAIYMQHTPAGRRMRAVMQNRPLASVSGVRTTRVDRTTFFIGSGLAGLAGVGITLLGPVGPTLGLGYIIDAFLVVIVGGLGQLRGAILAALALGMANSFIEYNTSTSIAKAGVFLLIVLFLQWRPQGIVVQQRRGLT